MDAARASLFMGAGIGAAAIAYGLFGLEVLLAVVVLVGLYVALSLQFVGEDDQLVISYFTSTEVVNGPRVVFVPFLVLNVRRRKPLLLGPLEYSVVKNGLTGQSWVEHGPKLLFLAAYDEAGPAQQSISLTATEFVRFLDLSTGKVRVERGEQGNVVPAANEVFLDTCGKRQAINLKIFEYAKIEDRRTGQIRVERGEKLIFLSGFEELIGGKQAAVEVDEETAVLLRNKRSGQQSLITEKQLFVPSADEEVLEVRNRIKLADYEACIVRSRDGKDTFFFGRHEAERSFFLPPHSELLQLQWSKGRRREHRNLLITKIDLRPMYMSFEFNCRTADNVELVLEGSFFWEVKDLEAMIKFTGDTTGDVCNHARSKFIELVSKVKLQEFMSNFNGIAAQVLKGDDVFYTQRGALIHSLEVSGYRCAEQATADTLQQIIQETTNRMNRMQQQESENEVQLFQIRGDIDEERARKDLLEIQTTNNTVRSRMEGLGEAERVKSFLSSLREEVPDLNERVSLWNVLRKGDALNCISKGSARVYFTPADVNLSIESHEHSREDPSVGSFNHVQ